MTLAEFIAKWSVPELRQRTERALSHEYLIDFFCRTIGIETPATVDPSGRRVALEFPVTLRDGSLGFIDLMIDRCAVEIKRPRTSLAAALPQLRKYAAAVPRLSIFIATNFDDLAVFTRRGLASGKPIYCCNLATLDQDALAFFRVACCDPDRLNRCRVPFGRNRVTAARPAASRHAGRRMQIHRSSPTEPTAAKAARTAKRKETKSSNGRQRPIA